MKRLSLLMLAMMIALAALAGCGNNNSAEKAREQAALQGACQDNLRTIDSCVMQYAAANYGNYPASVSALVPMYLKEELDCPAGGTYTLTKGTPPRATCSLGHTY